MCACILVHGLTAAACRRACHLHAGTIMAGIYTAHTHVAQQMTLRCSLYNLKPMDPRRLKWRMKKLRRLYINYKSFFLRSIITSALDIYIGGEKKSIYKQYTFDVSGENWSLVHAKHEKLATPTLYAQVNIFKTSVTRDISKKYMRYTVLPTPSPLKIPRKPPATW